MPHNTESEHLRQRMAQRNTTWSDIELTLARGRVLYRCGAEFYFLGARDLPEPLRRTHAHLIGTTVIVANGEIRTVYRNRSAHASIRRKAETTWHVWRPRRA